MGVPVSNTAGVSGTDNIIVIQDFVGISVHHVTIPALDLFIPTRNNRIRVSEIIDFYQHTDPGYEKTIDVDTIGFLEFVETARDGTNFTTKTVIDNVFISDTLAHTNPTANFERESFDAVTITDLVFYDVHVPAAYFEWFPSYLIIRDSVSKKILHHSHDTEEMDDVISGVLLDYFLCKDTILWEMTSPASRQFSVGNLVKIEESVDFVHLPFYKDLVYHIDYDSFTKFIKLNPKEAHSLTYGSTLVNSVFMIDQDNKIQKYPGGLDVSESLLQTKSFYIEHGVLQQFLLDYEKDTDTTNYIKSILNNADTAVIKTDDLEEINANKWVGISNAMSRGFKLSFLMRNMKRLKHMIFRFKTRLRE